jgi:DNA-binding transcriptional LysR family regulator
MIYSWDDLHIFMTIVEKGSFRAATITHALSYNTVRSRIARLEDVLGSKLLIRSNMGVTPTPQGHNLKRVALAMRDVSSSLASTQPPQTPAVESCYRIIATEGLAAIWIVPQLSNLLHQNQELEISIYCPDGSDKPVHEVHDFSIQLNKPTDDSLTCKRLGYLHLQPFASSDYITAHGLPRNVAEARNHRWVMQEVQYIPKEVSAAFFGDEMPKKNIVFVTNSSSAHFAAIACGLGLGILPNYTSELKAAVHPIDIGLSFRREIWLVYRTELNSDKITKKIVDWLGSCFNQNSFGYFSDEGGSEEEDAILRQSERLSHLLLQ